MAPSPGKRRTARVPPPDRSLPLRFGADQEAWLIDEVDDRKPELVAQVHEACQLLGSIRGQASGVVVRIGGEYTDRPPVEACQDRAKGTPVLRAQLEQRAPIEHRFEDRSRLVGLAPVARHDREQVLLAAVARITGRHQRRRLPDVRGKKGKEMLDLRERVLLVLRLVVHRACASLCPRAAELLLVGRLSHRGCHHRGTGDEHLGRSAHDHREVRGNHSRGAQAGHRPSAAATTGTMERFSAATSQPGMNGTYV